MKRFLSLEMVSGYVLGAVVMFLFFMWMRSIENKKVITLPPVNEISEMLQLGYGMTEDEADVYSLMFSKCAKKYNMDWRIYPAIITMESNWNVDAQSDSGAIGIMQVLPSTFKIYCIKLNVPYRENKTIYNNILNLKIGLEYLSIMINKYGIERGVKSYIGGPKHSNTNKTCKEYFVKFKSEYAKVLALSKDYEAYEVMTLNRILKQ